MRFDGTLQSWNDDRGFGFIEPPAGGDPVFVHIKAFRPLGERPRPGQRVRFEVEPGRDGKKRAVNVELVAQAPRPRPARPARSTRPASRRASASSGGRAGSAAALWALPAFVLMLAAGYILGHPPRWLLGVYPLASLVTYLVYAWDKSAARAGAWRVSERTLHLLALAGGWPGAVLAQQTLRHKSAKAAFRAVFWLTVLANAAGFSWLASPYGLALGQQLGTSLGR